MSDTNNKTLTIFVYGSLKRGFGNHGVMERAGGRFIGEAQTEAGFTMYSLGGFPGVIRTGEGSVKGELYEVPVTGLPGLDMLEGHPNFYRRETIRLESGQEVLTYLLPVRKEYTEGCPIVEDGVWEKRNWR